MQLMSSVNCVFVNLSSTHAFGEYCFTPEIQTQKLFRNTLIKEICLMVINKSICLDPLSFYKRKLSSEECWRLAKSGE